MPKKNQPFDMAQWQNDTGNDLYGQISREVNRHNYGLLLSDQKMNELRKIIYRMVSRWSRRDKINLIATYGDGNLIRGSENDGQINRILTETLIINMDAEKLESLAAGTKSKLAGLEKKARYAQKNADIKGREVKSALLNMMKTFERLKDAKNQKEYTKHIKDDGIVPSKIIKGNYNKLKAELTEYLRTKNIMEIRNLAAQLGIDIDENEKLGPKEIIHRICNLAALYLDIITGKLKNLYYGNVIHNTEALDGILSFTSYGFLVGDGTGLSPEEALLKRKLAVLNKLIQKERLDAMKRRSKTSSGAFAKVAGFNSITTAGAVKKIKRNDTGVLKDASVDEVLSLATKYGVTPSKNIAKMKVEIYKALGALAAVYRKYNAAVEKSLRKGEDNAEARMNRDAIGANIQLTGLSDTRFIDNDFSIIRSTTGDDSIEVTDADVLEYQSTISKFSTLIFEADSRIAASTFAMRIFEAFGANRKDKSFANLPNQSNIHVSPLDLSGASTAGMCVLKYMIDVLGIKPDVLFTPLRGKSGQKLHTMVKIGETKYTIPLFLKNTGLAKKFSIVLEYATYFAYIYLIAKKRLAAAKALKKEYKLPAKSYRDVVSLKKRAGRIGKKIGIGVGIAAGIAGIIATLPFTGIVGIGTAAAGAGFVLVKGAVKIGTGIGRFFKQSRNADSIDLLPERDKEFYKTLMQSNVGSLKNICENYGIGKYTWINERSKNKTPETRNIFIDIDDILSKKFSNDSKDVEKDIYIYMIATKKQFKSLVKFLKKKLDSLLFGADKLMERILSALKGKFGAIGKVLNFARNLFTFKHVREGLHAAGALKGRGESKATDILKNVGAKPGDASIDMADEPLTDVLKILNVVSEMSDLLKQTLPLIATATSPMAPIELSKEQKSALAQAISDVNKLTTSRLSRIPKTYDDVVDTAKVDFTTEMSADHKTILKADRAVSHEARSLDLIKIVKKPAEPVYVVNWNNRDPAYEWLSQNMPIFASGFISPFIPFMSGIAPTMLSLAAAEGIAISAAQASGMVAYAKGSKNINARKGGAKNNRSKASSIVNKNKKLANAGIPPIAITTDTSNKHATQATVKKSDFKKVPDYVPKYATGTKDVATTQFISGDSLNSSPNPELVSIDWENKNAAVKPIPQDQKIKYQHSPNPLTNKERNLPLNVSIKNNVVRYSSITLPNNVTDDGSGEALKVFNIRNPITETVTINGKNVSTMDILASISATLGLILDATNTNISTNAITAQNTAKVTELLKLLATASDNSETSISDNGFTSTLDNILKGR